MIAASDQASLYSYEPIESCSKPDFERCALLLAETFPATDKYTASFLSWQYLDNPVGHVVGFNATDKQTGEIAAHYATIPVRARMNGSDCLGLLSLNTATSVRHQGRGLFARLATMTYDLARERGFKFVVGVANANSTPGFVRKLGFQLVTPLRALVGFGRLPVRRHDRVDHASFQRIWDDPSLRWRTRNPSTSYAVAGTGARETYLVSPTDRWGIEAILWRGNRDTASSWGLPSSGSGPKLRVWLGLDPDMTRPFPWYVPIPRRMQPSPLNMIFRDLTTLGRTVAAERAYFEALDFDPY